MVHQLSDAEQVTVLNFSAKPITATVHSAFLVSGSMVVDMVTDEEVGEVDDLHNFYLTLGPHEGRSLLVLCPGDRPLGDHPHEHPHALSRPSVRPKPAP